jgi:hypothetical protein
MTKKRKLMLAVGIFAVSVVAVPVGLEVWRQYHAPRHFIDVEHLGRIKKGMTQEEVEAIFGVPPGTYTKKRSVSFDTNSFGMLGAGKRVEQWTGDQGRVVVGFDEQGAVMFILFIVYSEVQGPSFLQQVQTWLGF